MKAWLAFLEISYFHPFDHSALWNVIWPLGILSTKAHFFYPILNLNGLKSFFFRQPLVEWGGVCTLLCLLVRRSKEFFWQSKASSYTASSCTSLADYGNTGCGVFKWGVQNSRGFCLRINILKVNYSILRIGLVGASEVFKNQSFKSQLFSSSR